MSDSTNAFQNMLGRIERLCDAPYTIRQLRIIADADGPWSRGKCIAEIIEAEEFEQAIIKESLDFALGFALGGGDDIE